MLISISRAALASSPHVRPVAWGSRDGDGGLGSCCGNGSGSGFGGVGGLHRALSERRARGSLLHLSTRARSPRSLPPARRVHAHGVGAAGEKLHTGRSRNDQVATDMRLFFLDAATQLEAGIVAVMKVLHNQDHANSLRLLGLERVRQYYWEKLAQDMEAVYLSRGS